MGRINCPMIAKKIESRGERGGKPARLVGDVIEGIREGRIGERDFWVLPFQD